MADQCTILRVPFFVQTREQVLVTMRGWLTGERSFHFITTPNPEFLVRAVYDNSFRKLLQQSALRLPDGFGLVAAARLLWGVRLRRFTGADAAIELARLAAGNGSRLFLLGGWSGDAIRVGESLRRLYPTLQIVGAESGDGADSPGGEAGLMGRLTAARPDVLVVAYAAPRQERWIAAHREVLPSVRIAIGVGGTFDYLSGSIPRAPHAWRRLGLEWLYRLWRQPRRVGRILTAVIVFPLLALGDRCWQLLRSYRVRYTSNHD